MSAGEPPPYQEVTGQQGYGTVPGAAPPYPQPGKYPGGPQHPQGGYTNPAGPPAGAYTGAPYTNNTGAPYTNPQQAGYQQGYQNYTSSNVIVQQQPASQVVIVGGCPACRVGVLEEDYTCLGVLCAILFFPLGVLCCLAMRQRRCPSCGAVFD
ncbi:membrane protein BRI3-like [Ylistrum balloti]|uniref:membrane protein BRI3-like n=1 Tax=Ylistrum balloti TaxID=509963 RepID=UPI002905ED83|nr:membrane protein BRI3-like [Ylistrum balloti]XP_060068599.1 membrane protein BRI3-like [Ylistrum balloti]